MKESSALLDLVYQILNNTLKPRVPFSSKTDSWEVLAEDLSPVDSYLLLTLSCLVVDVDPWQGEFIFLPILPVFQNINILLYLSCL